MKIEIELLSLEELREYMFEMSQDAFFEFRDEKIFNEYSLKLCENAMFCVAREYDKIVGMIAFYANGKGEEGVCYIPLVYVSPRARKLGLFSDMLIKTKEYARSLEYTKIKLEVNRDNFIAKIAYMNKGFFCADRKNEKNSEKKLMILNLQ